MNRLLLLIVCFLIIFVDIGLADDYGYEDSYDGIVKRLSASEKTIKKFFDQTGSGGVNRQIEIYREKNGNPEKDIIKIDESQSFPFVNLRIYFDTNSSYIRPDSYPILTQLGRALTSDTLKERIVAIKGHTDSLGARDHNRILSFKRAMAVKEYLINNFNIQKARLQALGFGSELPIVGNITESERQINRRVEIEMHGIYNKSN